MRRDDLPKNIACIALSAFAFASAITVHLNRPKTAIAKAEEMYRLRDNWVLNCDGIWDDNGGYWEDRYYWYNCYAFAIQDALEGSGIDLSDQRPDSMSVGDMVGMTTNPSVTAYLTKMDLIALGYEAETYSYEPEIEPWQKLICVRTGLSDDYHYMRYGNDGFWYHKPTHSAPLCYRFHPEEQAVWAMEESILGEEFSASGYSYNSETYYITYGKRPIYAEETVNIEANGLIDLCTHYFDEDDDVCHLADDIL